MNLTLEHNLLGHTPSGYVRCTCDGWQGEAYKIPLDMLFVDETDYLKDKEAVYLLLDSTQKAVYVGQAGKRDSGDGVLNRLKEHRDNPPNGIENWHDAIVLVYSGRGISFVGERLWLEQKIYTEIKNKNIYKPIQIKPVGGNPQNARNISNYFTKLKLIICMLGYPVLGDVSTSKERQVSSPQKSIAVSKTKSSKIKSKTTTTKGEEKSSEGTHRYYEQNKRRIENFMEVYNQLPKTYKVEGNLKTAVGIVSSVDPNTDWRPAQRDCVYLQTQELKKYLESIK
jgi:hypothetical protein